MLLSVLRCSGGTRCLSKASLAVAVLDFMDLLSCERQPLNQPEKQNWPQAGIRFVVLLLALASSTSVASAGTADCRLRVIVQPQWDSTRLVRGSLRLTNVAGQAFSVTRLDLFVSDFSLQ